MRETTRIASAITKNENKKVYDEYCKRILSNKQILAYVMKGCIPEYEDTPLEEIPACIELSATESEMIDERSIEVVDEAIPGSQIKYDIQFEAALPCKYKAEGSEEKRSSDKEKLCLIINLESQAKDNPGYPLIKRALYYSSRLVAKQKNAELGFANSKYGEIKKVYSIWICIGHAKQKNDVINSYTIQESCHTKIWHAPRNHFDIMTAVMVYPQVEAFQNGKEDREAQKPVKKFEEKLLELLKVLFIKDFSMEKKKERLEKEYGIMMKRETESEVMEMCNFSDFIEERGIKKGLEQGLEQGKVNTTVQYVQNLMQFSNLSAVEAMKMLGVEKELQSVILNELHQA